MSPYPVPGPNLAMTVVLPHVTLGMSVVMPDARLGLTSSQGQTSGALVGTLDMTPSISATLGMEHKLRTPTVYGSAPL